MRVDRRPPKSSAAVARLCDAYQLTTRNQPRTISRTTFGSQLDIRPAQRVVWSPCSRRSRANTLIVSHTSLDFVSHHPTRPTRPPTLSGTRNEYRAKCGDVLRLRVNAGMAHFVCGCISGWQVKLCNPSLTGAIPKCLELDTHYPCPRAVFVNACVKNDTRVHGPWTRVPVFMGRVHGVRAVDTAVEHGPWTREVCSEHRHISKS